MATIVESAPAEDDECTTSSTKLGSRCERPSEPRQSPSAVQNAKPVRSRELTTSLRNTAQAESVTLNESAVSRPKKRRSVTIDSMPLEWIVGAQARTDTARRSEHLGNRTRGFTAQNVSESGEPDPVLRRPLAPPLRPRHSVCRGESRGHFRWRSHTGCSTTVARAHRPHLSDRRMGDPTDAAARAGSHWSRSTGRAQGDYRVGVSNPSRTRVAPAGIPSAKTVSILAPPWPGPTFPKGDGPTRDGSLARRAAAGRMARLRALAPLPWHQVEAGTQSAAHLRTVSR